jgi:uncharacterized lipoprotein YajG
MKKTILAVSAALTMIAGASLDSTPFTLAPNTGLMPLAVIGGNTVSIEYKEANGQDTLSVIIQGKDANGNDNTHTITGSAQGDVYYVDGAFWVLCRPAQQ